VRSYWWGKIAPGDEVSVFFSGHGIEIEADNNLIPRDAPAVGTGEARRLENESPSFDEMHGDLAAQGPTLGVLLIDARLDCTICRLRPCCRLW
jgi:hypothetical protein